MKPAVLSAILLGAFAIGASASLVVSASPPVSISSSASPRSETAQELPAPVKTSAAVSLETGRPPVPLLRSPNEPAQIPPAAAPAPGPAPLAEAPAPSVPSPIPSDTVPRGSPPGLEDVPAVDQRLHSALAMLPRGPDVRYWIVPLDDGRVRVIVSRTGDPGPNSWDNKAPRHPRRGWYWR